MNPTTLRQEIRKMRFEETWNEWKKGRLTQEEAGRILGMKEGGTRNYTWGKKTLQERGAVKKAHGKGKISEETGASALGRKPQ
jgi:hypothetical protein